MFKISTSLLQFYNYTNLSNLFRSFQVLLNLRTQITQSQFVVYQTNSNSSATTTGAKPATRAEIAELEVRSATEPTSFVMVLPFENI